jgi:hypothetical protein
MDIEIVTYRFIVCDPNIAVFAVEFGLTHPVFRHVSASPGIALFK